MSTLFITVCRNVWIDYLIERDIYSTFMHCIDRTENRMVSDGGVCVCVYVSVLCLEFGAICFMKICVSVNS